MYSIGHIHQLGSENKSRIYPPRPWRMISLGSCKIPALHAVPVHLWHVAVRSGGVDQNCVGDLVAIHRLGEMDLELDTLVGDHTKVVPWEKLGDDRFRAFIFLR